MGNEKTLVLIKPDGVKRGLIGEIISRIEKAGLKIAGMKMLSVNEDFAKQHYSEEMAQRHNEEVRSWNVGFLQSGPVIAMCVEGIDSIDNIRKMVGTTEPKRAMPGTIRGDYAHISYSQTNTDKKAVQNLIHASANSEDAKKELNLWFSTEEICNYKTVHEAHTF